MNHCDRMIDVDALIDGEAGEDAAGIERHVAGCAACRAYRASALRSDERLRRAARDRVPDAALEERLFGPARMPAHPGRRRVLTGLGAVAAGAAGLGLILRPGTADAGAFCDAVLGDFATGIAADRPLDIVASEAEHLRPWAAARVPFVLPERVAPEGGRLLGCRLCWLVGRRLAAFSIEMQGTPLGLYIAGSDGLEGLPEAATGAAPLLTGGDGLHGAFWRERGLASGIVGGVSAERLVALAGTLRG